MRSSATTALAGVLLLWLTGCLGPRVDSDWDPGFDFAEVESYAWIEPQLNEDDPNAKLRGNTLLAERIERAVDPVLHRRGMREVLPEAADLFVTHHIGIDQRYDVTTTNYGYGWGWGYVGYGGFGPGGFGYGGPTFSDSVVRRVEEATLIVDLIEPSSGRLVWRGTGPLDLEVQGTPEERERRVRETVEAILAQFPPGRPSE